MPDAEDIKSKLCNTPIRIDEWRQDDTYEGVFPKGARDKSAYFSPRDCREEYLKANHRYLFKLSRSWCPWQFWGEIVAYRLGLLMGIEVPPTHVGVSDRYSPGQTTYGALIEWFYDDQKDVYIEGGQFMMQLVQDYDRERGTKHNFLDFAKVLKGIPGFYEHWTGVFTLDCIIGNTDRHQDNWGLVVEDGKLKRRKNVSLRFSPAFDNGTALAYEVVNRKIEKYADENRLKSYLTNPRHARHHMKWSLDEGQECNFYEFMRKFVMAYPDGRDIIRRHLAFSQSQVEEIIRPLVSSEVAGGYCLSEKRWCFVLELILRRKVLLEEALGI